MRAFSLLVVLLVGFVTAVIFAAYPLLDLQIAGYFQQPESKSLFRYLNPYLAAVRDHSTAMTVTFILLPLFSILLKLCWPSAPMLIPARASILIIATFALGPGLMANGILKSHWHRPRPEAVAEFGGKLPFVQWWDSRGACSRNCSFVSGEVAAASALLAPAVMIPPPWRYPAVGAALLYVSGISFLRVAFGRHFVTDIIFSVVFVALIVWLLHGFLFTWRRTRLSEASAELGIEKVGMAIRSRLGIRQFARRQTSTSRPRLDDRRRG